METKEYLGLNQTPSPDDFASLEQEYGFTLPEDFKAHLLQHNGGWIRGGAAFVQPADESGNQPIRRLRNFKSVRYGTSTIEDSLEDFGGELHPDLVPFGSESGGDVFVLSVGPEDYGSVYYVAHELYTPPAFLEEDAAAPPREYGPGVFFLAPSFTAFLTGLVTPTSA